jgi:hypothetical protein
VVLPAVVVDTVLLANLPIRLHQVILLVMVVLVQQIQLQVHQSQELVAEAAVVPALIVQLVVLALVVVEMVQTQLQLLQQVQQIPVVAAVEDQAVMLFPLQALGDLVLLLYDISFNN